MDEPKLRDKQRYPLTYVAIPYRHPDKGTVLERVEIANRAAGYLMQRGEIVFSPISHSHPIAEACSLPHQFGFWKEQDFAFLSHCHKLVVLAVSGWHESEGVLAEIDYAIQNDMRIEYLVPPFPWERLPADSHVPRGT